AQRIWIGEHKDLSAARSRFDALIGLEQPRVDALVELIEPVVRVPATVTAFKRAACPNTAETCIVSADAHQHNVGVAGSLQDRDLRLAAGNRRRPCWLLRRSENVFG